jgi:tRNA 2-selenouridine synthase
MSALEVIHSADAATRARFDAIIDVRSPAEFAEDHAPGAINLPVLSNDERAVVGTIYVQEDKFRARRLGAALVARNVAAHLEGALAEMPGSSRLLVYCWRGGQRSQGMATILAQVGWRTALLHGGYKTYRREITARLYGPEPALRLVLLDGHTGTAKTEILGRLTARGVQTLDLEGLAQHRGSLFGALPGRPQPSQKLFESRLVEALDRLDPTRPIVAEAESSKIGELMNPPMLWKAMQAAPRIVVEAPPAERARYLVRAYHDIVEDPAALTEALTRLPTHPGRKRLEAWSELAAAGAWEALAQALIELHYDPAYDRSSRQDERRLLGSFQMDGLDAPHQESVADRIARLVADAA